MPTSSSLSRRQLDQLARIGAQARLQELQAEVAALKGILGGSAAPSAAPKRQSGRRRRRGQLSAAGRAAISRAQIARWAKTKGKAQRTGRKRRGMSTAQKAEVSRRMKKYWAERRKAKKAA